MPRKVPRWFLCCSCSLIVFPTLQLDNLCYVDVDPHLHFFPDTLGTQFCSILLH